MRKLILALILIMVISLGIASTQSMASASTNSSVSQSYWVKTYGGSGNDVIKDIKVLPDGNIIAVGYTNSSGSGGEDAFVMKLSPDGTVLWAKTYGGYEDDRANAVALAPNGDIIVVGVYGGHWKKYSRCSREIYDAWVLRLDENGNVKWQKTYGGSDNDEANAVAVTSNGEIIVAGSSSSFGEVGTDRFGCPLSNGWVFKLDRDGNILWQKEYFTSSSKSQQINAVAITPDGNIIVAGTITMELDPEGNIIWTRNYGVANWWEGAYAVTVTPEGDIILAGVTSISGAGDADVWVLRLDENGNVIWQKTYGGKDWDAAYAVALAPNGDIIVAGETNSFGVPSSHDAFDMGGDDAWVLRLPPTGVLPNWTSYKDSDAQVNNLNGKGFTPLVTSGPSNSTESLVDTHIMSWNPKIETLYHKVIYYGYLTIDSSPSNAEVYVNGSYKGVTPLSLQLPAGTYVVKLSKTGYENYTTNVTIQIEKTTKISAILKVIPPITTTSPRIPNITTTQTQSQARTNGTSTPQTTTSESTTTNVINLLYIAGALIVLVLIGGVAAKAKGGKSKPSPPAEAVSTPTPARKPEPKHYTPPKNIPGFPPELLDKYEPLEFLGEGGFAKVFKAKRRKDGKIIALKVSRLDEKAKKFFLKEVKAWRLLDHPNIVKLYNAYAEPLPHLEIEFVDGIKLNGEVIRDLGKYPKPTDEKKALHFIKGIAEGLKHAHSKQVYHRDLKPQNVLITSDLTPKITDWGLAKVGAVSTTATTTKGLTLLYAAPEQLDDETYGHTDQRTDIYQLGLIFYELLTGRLPYQGTSPAVVMAKVINPAVNPKPPSHYNKALAKYDGIFEKLLAKRKEDRYQGVEEFFKDLELMKKLDEERKALEKEIEETKTTMSLTTDSKELKKLIRQLVGQLSRNALLHAQLNDKAGLINALEDLKAFSKEHRDEIGGVIAQLEVMMRESVPISKSTIDELKVLLHKVQKEGGVE